MKGKTFTVVGKAKSTSQFIQSAEFSRFQDTLSRFSSEARSRGSSVVVPADGIKLSLDGVTLPVKIGGEGARNKYKMTETFLIQLVSTLELSPKMFDSLPHDLVVEAINRALSSSISRHFKVRVVGEVASAIMNTRYSFVNVADTLSVVYDNFYRNNPASPEMMFICGYADTLGTVRTIWAYPTIRSVVDGKAVYAGAELLMNIHMVCHPTVTPAVISDAGAALFKTRNGAVEPTGTTEQAHNAIVSKLRASRSISGQYADGLPKLASMPFDDSYDWMVAPIKSALAIRGVLPKNEKATLLDVFTAIFNSSQKNLANLLKAREGEILLGYMMEEALGVSEPAV
jgi:hypothetical protein